MVRLAKVSGCAARCAERLCLSGVGFSSESRLRLGSREAQPRQTIQKKAGPVRQSLTALQAAQP